MNGDKSKGKFIIGRLLYFMDRCRSRFSLPAHYILSLTNTPFTFPLVLVRERIRAGRIEKLGRHLLLMVFAIHII